MADAASRSTVEITGEIVAAYLRNHAVGADQLPELIRSVHRTLDSVGQATADADGPSPAPSGTESRPVQGVAAPSAARTSGKRRGREPGDPAVPVSQSVMPDYLICLEDGKQLKMLKRYLNSNYGLTPAEYRAKWGLPADYPMVAENYSKRRSEAAKRFGLGRKGFRRKAAASTD